MPIYWRNGKAEIRLTLKGVKYYRQVPEAGDDEYLAKVAEANLIKEIYEGRYGKEGKEIGATDFVKYCREVYKPHVKEYLKNWKDRWNKVEVLCAYFKGKRLKDITRLEVAKYKRKRLSMESLRGGKVKPITVKGEITVLSSIFTLAIDDELIGLNPCRKIKWQKDEIESHRERVLSYEEEDRLMPHLKGETRAAVIIALNTGLRRMGILNSRVRDVNAGERSLTYIAKGGKKRKVPLNPVAWAVVQELMEGATSDGYLFHRRSGHNLSSPNCAFQTAKRKAGIQNLTFHDLRHTFATRVRKHTDPYTGRDLLAHADIKQTGDYITVSLEDMRQAVDALCEARVLQFKQKTG